MSSLESWLPLMMLPSRICCLLGPCAWTPPQKIIICSLKLLLSSIFIQRKMLLIWEQWRFRFCFFLILSFLNFEDYFYLSSDYSKFFHYLSSKIYVLFSFSEILILGDFNVIHRQWLSMVVKMQPLNLSTAFPSRITLSKDTFIFGCLGDKPKMFNFSELEILLLVFKLFLYLVSSNHISFMYPVPFF